MSKRKGFTQIDNSFWDDPKLSWKAKAIYGYLLSRGGDTRSSEADIASRSKEGIRAVRSGIQELMDANLLTRSVLFDKKTGQKRSHYHCVRTSLKAYKLPRRKEDQPELKPFKWKPSDKPF